MLISLASEMNRNTPRLEKFPRNASPQESLLPDNGIPENPRAMESLRVVAGQEYRSGSNGASQCAEDSTRPDISSLPTSDPAKAGDTSALPRNPK